jgi:hypothetical protein
MMNISCNAAIRHAYQIILTSITLIAVNAVNLHGQSCDFGDVTIGSFKDSTVKVTNTYPIALTVNTISLKNNPSDYAILSGTAPFTLPVGGTCTFSVRFTPSMPGLRTDSIVISGLFPGPVYLELRGTGVLVPVELASFSARLVDDDVVLSWMTESEENNSGFEIERSESNGDRNRFASIAFMPGAGTSRSVHEYRYVDRISNALKQTGLIWYRLRQIDNDGGASYSSIVSVKINQAIGTESIRFGIWPNPSNGIISIHGYSVREKRFMLRVYDDLGRCSYVKDVEVSNADCTFIVQLSTGEFAHGKGMYMVAAECADERFAVPVLIMK